MAVGPRVDQVLQSVAVDVGRKHAACCRGVLKAGRAERVVAPLTVPQPVPVAAGLRNDQIALPVAVEIDRDGLLIKRGRSVCSDDRRSLESICTAAQDCPSAGRLVEVGEVLEAIAVHVAGERVCGRARCTARRYFRPQPGIRALGRERGRRQAVIMRALPHAREPAARRGAGRRVSEFVSAKRQVDGQVLDLDPRQALRFTRYAAADIGGRHVVRRAGLVVESHRVVRCSARHAVAGVIDVAWTVGPVGTVLDVAERHVVAVAIANRAEGPLTRRRAADRLDPGIRRGAVLVDQARPGLRPEPCRPAARRALGRHAGELLDLCLVGGSGPSIGTADPTQSLSAEAQAVRFVERDAREPAVLRERARAASDRRKTRQSEAHTEQAVAATAVVGDRNARCQAVRARRQSQRHHVPGRTRGRHGRRARSPPNRRFLRLGRSTNEHTQRQPGPSQSCAPIHSGYHPWRRPARCRLPVSHWNRARGSRRAEKLT